MEAWRKHDKGRTARTKADMAFTHPPKDGDRVGSPIFFGEYYDDMLSQSPDLFEGEGALTRADVEEMFQEDIDAAKKAKKKTK